MNRLLILLLLAAMAAPFPAEAAKKLTGPYAVEGRTKVETRLGYRFDADNSRDDDFDTEINMTHGLTDFWEVKAGYDMRDRGRGRDLEPDTLFLQNKFRLAEKGALFVDPAIRFEYAKSLQDGPDEAAVKFIAAKEIDGTRHILNYKLAREIGEKAGHDWDSSAAYGFSLAISENVKGGLEYYADFDSFDGGYDDQRHQLGPVLYAKNESGFTAEIGLLAGLSRAAPDAELKLIVGKAF